MIIFQKLQSMPLLLGFWWVSPGLISSVLHFRTEAGEDFSFSGHFMSGFSHNENVFSTRDCCRCNAVQQGMEIPHFLTKPGARECSWRHWGPGVWLSQCSLHPAPWLQACGNPCKGVEAVGWDCCGCSWSWAAGSCTQTQAGGWGTAWVSLWCGRCWYILCGTG